MAKLAYSDLAAIDMVRNASKLGVALLTGTFLLSSLAAEPALAKGGRGLAIVDQIITRAGGSIRAESVEGQGTTIRLYLPRIANAAVILVAQQDRERRPRPQLGTGRAAARGGMVDHRTSGNPQHS